MKIKSVIPKILLVLILLFTGNRLFNHVSAWGGILTMLAAVALGVYFIFKTTKNNTEKQ